MDKRAERVLAFIREHRLIAPGEKVLLSLSAGKDSMALLHILRELGDELPVHLSIFHLNHAARGDESDGDEEFLRGTAELLGIPFRGERFDIAASRPPGRSFEDYAREVRYRFLGESAAREGCTAIATAHTLDDSVETVIMRVFEGTGIHGLAGIEPKRGSVIRPLLCLESEEVYAYLRERGIAWREDSSNLDTKHLRNYVRRELIPTLRGRFPGYARALAGLSAAARDHGELLDGFIGREHGSLRETRPGGVVAIDLEECGGNNLLIRHLVAASFRELGAHVSAGMLEEITRRLASRKGNVELFRGRGLRAVRRIEKGRGMILIAPDTKEIRDSGWEFRVDLSALPVTIEVPGTALSLEFSWTDKARFREDCGAPGIVHLAVGPDDTVTVRARRTGDRMLLSGAKKKIKELFIDQKLDNVTKNLAPLVVAGGSVAASLAGLLGNVQNRVADGYLVGPGTKKILAIRGFRN
jgi:tRNA(Ile)-lysidine synthase